MPRNLKTQAQLQAEITKLKQENVHLRTLLKVIWDTAGQAVEKGQVVEKEEEKEEILLIKPCSSCRKNINLQKDKG